MLDDFKKFLMRGNVIDLAVGVIIGGAFGKIITSLVSDMIMPAVAYMIGGSSFNYGAFIQTTIDFAIIAFVIFLAVKAMNEIRRKQEEPVAAPGPSDEVKLLTEIRDALNTKKD